MKGRMKNERKESRHVGLNKNRINTTIKIIKRNKKEEIDEMDIAWLKQRKNEGLMKLKNEGQGNKENAERTGRKEEKKRRLRDINDGKSEGMREWRSRKNRMTGKLQESEWRKEWKKIGKREE